MRSSRGPYTWGLDEEQFLAFGLSRRARGLLLAAAVAMIGLSIGFPSARREVQSLGRDLVTWVVTPPAGIHQAGQD